MAADDIWYNQPRVLLARWTEFFPSREQSAEERVNSLVRLCVYASLALYAYRRDPRVVAAGLIVAGVITVAYRPGRELLGPSAPAASRTPAARTVQGPFGPQAVDYVPAPAAPADEACVLPTASNPFGNFLLTDHADRPDRAPACEYDFVKDDIRREFNDGLPRNVGDVYERQNSQRQFYTMPNTRSLPDTKAFAEFLYGNSGGCKQDPSKCTGYN